MRRYHRETTTAPKIGIPRLGLACLLVAGTIAFAPRFRSQFTTQEFDTPSPAHAEVRVDIDHASASDRHHDATIHLAAVQTPTEPTSQDPEVSAIPSRSRSRSLTESETQDAEPVSDHRRIVDGSPRLTLEELEAWPHERARIESELPDLLSLSSDNTTKITKREMHSYWRLIKLAKFQSYGQLHETVSPAPRFADLIRSSSQLRGKLFRFDMEVRAVNVYPIEYENMAHVDQVYEIQGTTDQAPTRFQFLLTTELPEGLDVGTDRRLKVSFAGYYFKLQGYEPGSAKPGAPPIPAPLFVGRMDHVVPHVPLPSKMPSLPGPSIVLVVTVLSTALVAVIGYLYLSLRRRSNASKTMVGSSQKSNLDWIES